MFEINLGQVHVLFAYVLAVNGLRETKIIDALFRNAMEHFIVAFFFSFRKLAFVFFLS